MIRLARGVLHPEGYHGLSGGSPFFEAWYVKVATDDPTRSLVFIPGVFRGADPRSHHAFVQVLDDRTRRVTYHRFPLEAFEGSEDRFEVRVADNTFSSRGLRVELDGVQGRLSFDGTAPWPVTLRSPGVMGWFAWVPLMQCYHGVVSLDHRVRGSLHIDGENLSFVRGRGYIEKDWGRSFPRSWIWVQCNHFQERGVCLSASIADVPWIGGSFPGFLVGFFRSGRLERFTSYARSRITRLKASPGSVSLVLENESHRLEVDASGGEVARVHIPSESDMSGVVEERLEAAIAVRLFRRRQADSGGELLFEGASRHGAFEVHGDPSSLGALVILSETS